MIRKLPPSVFTTALGKELAFLAGFTSIAFQSLLFRRFFSGFDGNEWSLAVFFSTWLLWVGAGSVMARGMRRWMRRSNAAAFLLLLYIPAFVLQLFIIENARMLSGIAAYEAFSALSLLPIALLANAPVSLLTGILFVALVANNSSDETREHVASDVYIHEVAGSFVGGITVTLLLAATVSAMCVFLLTALLISVSVWVLCFGKRCKKYFAGLLAAALTIVLLTILLTRSYVPVTTWLNRLAWDRTLPAEGYTGSFSTSDSLYLYGAFHEQFNVLAWNSVYETLPNREEAVQIFAMALAQQPDARRLLVIGEGSYSVCKAFCMLSQIRDMIWLASDKKYTAQLQRFLSARLKIQDERFVIPPCTPRQYLQDSDVGAFDVIILNLPPGDTLAMNGYLTTSFFREVKNKLHAGAVFLVKIPGGSNYLGDELASMGASVYATLDSVFNHIIIKPGENTWLVASDAKSLTGDPALLATRYQAVPGASSILSEQWLWTIYDSERSNFQKKVYRNTITAFGGIMENTVRHPKSAFFATCFLLRKAMPNLPDLIRSVVLIQKGLPYAVSFFFCLYILTRVTGFFGSRDRTGKGFLYELDGRTLIFSAGFTGFTLNYILLLLFQSFFGSLFVYLGMISSLFMLGLFLGGKFSLVLIKRSGNVHTSIMIAVLLTVMACLLTYSSSFYPQQLFFVFLFFLAGLSGGFYIPIAESALNVHLLSDMKRAAAIELFDHTGAAVAAALCGLLIIPLMGMTNTLIFLGLLPFVIIIPPYIMKIDRNLVLAIVLPIIGIIGWVLFNREYDPNEALRMNRAADQARREVNVTISEPVPLTWLEKTIELSGGLLFPYEEKRSVKTPPVAYRFKTLPLDPDSIGYAGPIPMFITILSNGALQHIDFLPNQETPEYQIEAEGWCRSNLYGRSILNRESLLEVDVTTGATITEDAIRDGLITAGRNFFNLLSGKEVRLAKESWSDETIPDTRIEGEARRVNMKRLKKMINDRVLSDHPALYSTP